MHNQKNSFFFLSQSGCLLPFLILFNLLFGLVFLNLRYWLIIEAILVLAFLLNSYIMARRISCGHYFKKNDAIDVEGEVIQEKNQQKKIER